MGTTNELENNPEITLIPIILKKTVDYLADVTMELEIRLE